MWFILIVAVKNYNFNVVFHETKQTIQCYSFEQEYPFVNT